MPNQIPKVHEFRSHKDQKRTAVVTYRSETLNVEKRTIEFVLATDQPADFGGYFEILGMNDGEMRTKRLDDGIVPVLDSHPQAQWKVQTIDDQFGVVREWRKENGQIIGLLFFGSDERSDRAFKKVAEGVVKTGSIGYFAYNHVDTAPDSQGKKTYRAIDWEIVEFSLVSIPRDPDAQSRSLDPDQNQNKNLNEIKPSNERNGNMPPENEVIPKTITEADLATATKGADEAAVQRVMDIQAAVRSAKFGPEVAEDMIKRGLTLEAASKEIFQKMEARSKAEDEAKKINPSIDINHSEEAKKTESRREAIATAIEHRTDKSVKVEGLARNLAGLSLFEMQKESLRLEGKDVRSMDMETIIRQGFQGTSDFPIATQSAVAKKVKKGYDYVSNNYLPLITETSRSDFKTTASVSLSDAPALTKIKENGEFETGQFAESAEQYKIETFGKRIALTRQAIINDDLSLFSKVPYSMGVAGARLVQKAVFDIFKNNPEMADEENLFDSTAHKNVASNAASVQAAVEALLLLLRKQTSPKNEIMGYNPGYVIVGADLEIAARQLISQVNAAKSSDVNVLANTLQGVIVEASLAAKKVFLTGRSEEVDMIEVAWLNGNKGVNVRTRENSNILGVEWDVFMDFGIKALDYRGLYSGGLT